VESLGWEGMVMAYIEQHWSAGETFTRDDIHCNESNFALHYPDNQHIRSKLNQILRTLVANGQIEALNRTTFRRTLTVKDTP
jgi:hypothetical protein